MSAKNHSRNMRTAAVTATGVAVLGLSLGLGGYAIHRIHSSLSERAEYVKSHLEPDAPFLGLDNVTYEDRDRNGKLETYANIRLADTYGGFFEIRLNTDGSYRLIPARKIGV